VSAHVPSTQELDALWTDLANASAGESGRQTRRVMAESRHDCFLGVSYPGRHRLLSVVTDVVPPQGSQSRPLTSGIVLAHGTDPLSGRFSMDILLRADSHSEIFTALVADLLRALADSNLSHSSSEVLLARLEDWRRMLAAVTPDGLSSEQQRGLLASWPS
jgi:Putative  PD-(D/E)XK family member, (DUF4420)